MKPGYNLEARKRPVNLTLNEDFAIPFVVIVQSSQFDDYRRRVAALDELLSRAWKWRREIRPDGTRATTWHIIASVQFGHREE